MIVNKNKKKSSLKNKSVLEKRNFKAQELISTKQNKRTNMNNVITNNQVNTSKNLFVTNDDILVKNLLKQRSKIKPEVVDNNINLNLAMSSSKTRFKKHKSINLTARSKVGDLIKMNFKQVEQKFIGHLMRRGLRAKALAVWLRVLLLLKMHFYKSKIKFNVPSLIMKALDIIRPVVILKKRKIAGTVYQIPYFVQNMTRDNATLIAIRWFLESVNLRMEKDPAIRVYKEFLDIFKKQGFCYKKKMEVYDSAVKNRIYTRFLFSKSKKRKKI